MERPPTTVLRIGEWYVNPVSGQISRNGETVRVEARTMLLLLCLADHPGEVVSIDELLSRVWSDVVVSPDSVYQAVASLRRVLGDDPRQPNYIATVPRLGYRLIATVGPWEEQRLDPKDATSSPKDAREMAQPVRHARTLLRTRFLWAAAATVCLAFIILIVLQFRRKVANNTHAASPAIDVDAQSQKSIAVLPFLDLTEGMKQEEFADSMTEELIDKLSKIPGLQLPPPTSSFYFKGKQIPVSDIAKSLGVAYVLDGSVRKSGARLRIAVRLIRADDGYIVWSESYDRPVDDMLMVQDDIAGEITKALKTSIQARPPG